MRILVANNQLQNTGGTENYTYAIIVELLRLGHSVEYFTFIKGEVSDKIEQLGVRFKSKKTYDLIIANHNTTIEALSLYGCIVQTCHGIFPKLEQPSPYADYYVSISQEVQQHLLQQGFKSILIKNGIDCRRFYPKKEIHNELTSVLSLCQSDLANDFIAECCSDINVKFEKVNKFTDKLWDIEDHISNSDLVVGIGRSLYDAMACGRAVISYDHRYYDKDLGDGYLTSKNIEESIKFNCSGRGMQKSFTKESFIKDLEKYDKSDGVFFRNFAVENLNIELAVNKYLNITSTFNRNRLKVKKILRLSYQFTRRILLKKYS